MPVATAPAPSSTSDVQTMLKAALSSVGVYYKWGGNSLASGVDCSALVQQAFRYAGYDLPRVTYDQVGAGSQVSGIIDAQPGDLIFYPTGWGGNNSHVAIYLGDGQMIEAPHTGAQVRITGVRPGGNIRRVIGVMQKNGAGGNVELGPNASAMELAGQVAPTVTEQPQQQPGNQGFATIDTINPGAYSNMEAISGLKGMDAIPGSTPAAPAADAPASPAMPSSGPVDPTNAYQLALQAGASPGEARILAAIAQAESGLNPQAHNPNAATGDNSYGLWQINMLGNMGTSRARTWGLSSYDDLFDPATNARAAVDILRSQGLNAWSVYKSGAYKQYLTGVGGKS